MSSAKDVKEEVQEEVKQERDSSYDPVPRYFTHHNDYLSIDPSPLGATIGWSLCTIAMGILLPLLSGHCTFHCTNSYSTWMSTFMSSSRSAPASTSTASCARKSGTPSWEGARWSSRNSSSISAKSLRRVISSIMYSMQNSASSNSSSMTWRDATNQIVWWLARVSISRTSQRSGSCFRCLSHRKSRGTSRWRRSRIIAGCTCSILITSTNCPRRTPRIPFWQSMLANRRTTPLRPTREGWSHQYSRMPRRDWTCCVVAIPSV